MALSPALSQNQPARIDGPFYYHSMYVRARHVGDCVGSLVLYSQSENRHVTCDCGF